jgi:DNA-binding winged helix-turn-helix (wHTH) protein/Flp pilus assembly protein TadD
MRTYVVFRFGTFELDPATRQLRSEQEITSLPDSHFSMLLVMVESAPDVVEKNALAKAGWGGTAVSDNSIEQGVSCLRKALSQDADQSFIETVRHRGYRFVAYVERVELPDPDGAGGPAVEPFAAFLQGRRELATLNPKAIANASRALEHTIERAPNHAAAHASLGMACALLFEASRCDPTRDFALVTRAVHHARLATRLDPALADGWSSLAFALYHEGDTDAAAAAGRKAVALARNVWRHWLRLAYVSWGDERIETAETALSLRPDLALAHWLLASVLIARGAFEPALVAILAGCAAQDTQRNSPGPYPAVGLHLQHGLVLLALGRLDEAMRAFESELDVPDCGQLYARERAANTWYARGALHRRRAEHDAARMSFRHAVEINPRHYCAMAALGMPIPACSSNRDVVDIGIARAVAASCDGRHPAAAECYRNALNASAVSSAGWILPVEPILHVSQRPEIWNAALTIVQQRAS